MRKLRVWKYLFCFAVLAAAVVMLQTDAQAQCSMCKAVLSNTNARFIRNFNLGILVLLVPPVSIFCSIFILLKRHRIEERDKDDEG